MPACAFLVACCSSRTFRTATDQPSLNLFEKTSIDPLMYSTVDSIFSSIIHCGYSIISSNFHWTIRAMLDADN